MAKTTNTLKKRNAIIITIGIQKGGAGKTVASCVFSYLISKEYKVLLVDADPQGNSTETFTGKAVRTYRNTETPGIMTAFLNNDAHMAIEEITPSLHVLRGDERSGYFTNLFSDPETMAHYKNRDYLVEGLLKPLKLEYDFIIIDTGPMLGDLLTNCIIASDHVITMYEPSKYCASALLSFDENIQEVKHRLNLDVDLTGIVISLIDARRVDNREHIEVLRGDNYFGPKCFNNFISRSAAAGRISSNGLIGNPEVRQAVKQYIPILKELYERVNTKTTSKH